METSKVGGGGGFKWYCQKLQSTTKSKITLFEVDIWLLEHIAPHNKLYKITRPDVTDTCWGG